MGLIYFIPWFTLLKVDFPNTLKHVFIHCSEPNEYIRHVFQSRISMVQNIHSSILCLFTPQGTCVGKSLLMRCLHRKMNLQSKFHIFRFSRFGFELIRQSIFTVLSKREKLSWHPFKLYILRKCKIYYSQLSTDVHEI